MKTNSAPSVRAAPFTQTSEVTSPRCLVLIDELQYTPLSYAIDPKTEGLDADDNSGKP